MALDARAFVNEWVESWNAHDLDRILSHYADEAVMLSPVAQQRLGDGRVVGKGALRAYWAPAVGAGSTLHFTVVSFFVGFDALTIIYDSRGRGRVAETFEFGADGRVVRAMACAAAN